MKLLMAFFTVFLSYSLCLILPEKSYGGEARKVEESRSTAWFEKRGFSGDLEGYFGPGDMKPTVVAKAMKGISRKLSKSGKKLYLAVGRGNKTPWPNDMLEEAEKESALWVYNDPNVNSQKKDGAPHIPVALNKAPLPWFKGLKFDRIMFDWSTADTYSVRDLKNLLSRHMKPVGRLDVHPLKGSVTFRTFDELKDYIHKKHEHYNPTYYFVEMRGGRLHMGKEKAFSKILEKAGTLKVLAMSNVSTEYLPSMFFVGTDWDRKEARELLEKYLVQKTLGGKFRACRKLEKAYPYESHHAPYAYFYRCSGYGQRPGVGLTH